MSAPPFADHFLHVVVLATILAAFFALLWREGTRARRRFLVWMWFAIVGGSLATAWAMSLVGGR